MKLLLIVATLLLLAQAAWATTIQHQIGQDSLFQPNQQLNGGVSQFNSGVSGQPAPFDKFYGTDFGATFDKTWTHTFTAPAGQTLDSIKVTFGIFDVDAGATGDQVTDFEIGGVEFEDELNQYLEIALGPNAVILEPSITLPSGKFTPALLTAVQNGAIDIRLRLQASGLSSGNGAGLYFSKIELQFSPTNTPPSLTCSDINRLSSTSVSINLADTVSAVDVEDGALSFSCNVPNVHTFPVTTTSVTCTTQDQHGASASCSFSVFVMAPPKPAKALVFGDYHSRQQVANHLQALGDDVTLITSISLPADISSFTEIWMVNAFAQISDSDRDRLAAWTLQGGGLYLTGERPCCELNNDKAEEIMKLVLKDSLGAGLTVGGQGDHPGPLIFQNTAEGGIASTPNDLTAFNFPNRSPGGLVGVSGRNVLIQTGNGVPVGAVYGCEDTKSGQGRLVILMDVNWPTSSGVEVVVANIQTFLESSSCGASAAPGSCDCSKTVTLVNGEATTDSKNLPACCEGRKVCLTFA